MHECHQTEVYRGGTRRPQGASGIKSTSSAKQYGRRERLHVEIQYLRKGGVHDNVIL